ncbi:MULTISPECIES: dihydropteroate synthase [unclassified Acinetobacter]|uniref:dihydropteroate synthase n=1 Tax=unclassified Acinetobacter TaxID=196816 RepID=UPI0035B87696
MFTIEQLPHQQLHLNNQNTLDFSQPQIMGILNVTPDSFSDGGEYQRIDNAVQHALQMQADGASIIDIGGESTRPNAPEVSLQQELDRVMPIVEALKPYHLNLSIDTSSPEVMRQAVAAGASIWNDVRALTRPNALQTARELNIPVILMHNRGEPATMNSLAVYEDVMAEILCELQQRIDDALNAGIAKHHIIIDAGFGFAKNSHQNLILLKYCKQLNKLGYPILAGLSRKRFIGELLNQADVKDRDIASSMAHLWCVQQGASIVRTHNVKAMSDSLKVWQAICQTD